MCLLGATIPSAGCTSCVDELPPPDHVPQMLRSMVRLTTEQVSNLVAEAFGHRLLSGDHAIVGFGIGAQTQFLPKTEEGPHPS